MSSSSTDSRPIRLAIATCAAIPGIHADDQLPVTALNELGVQSTPCHWADPTIDWTRFDAVLIRTPRDYFQRYAEFLAWLDRLPIPTVNDNALLRWNSDKRYLLGGGRTLPPDGVGDDRAAPVLRASTRSSAALCRAVGGAVADAAGARLIGISQAGADPAYRVTPSCTGGAGPFAPPPYARV
jgi:hypothetical protein